jgi:hypothetical protein
MGGGASSTIGSTGVYSSSRRQHRAVVGRRQPAGAGLPCCCHTAAASTMGAAPPSNVAACVPSCTRFNVVCVYLLHSHVCMLQSCSCCSCNPLPHHDSGRFLSTTFVAPTVPWSTINQTTYSAYIPATSHTGSHLPQLPMCWVSWGGLGQLSSSTLEWTLEPALPPPCALTHHWQSM